MTTNGLGEKTFASTSSSSLGAYPIMWRSSLVACTLSCIEIIYILPGKNNSFCLSLQQLQLTDSFQTKVTLLFPNSNRAHPEWLDRENICRRFIFRTKTAFQITDLAGEFLDRLVDSGRLSQFRPELNNRSINACSFSLKMAAGVNEPDLASNVLFSHLSAYPDHHCYKHEPVGAWPEHRRSQLPLSAMTMPLQDRH